MRDATLGWRRRPLASRRAQTRRAYLSGAPRCAQQSARSFRPRRDAAVKAASTRSQPRLHMGPLDGNTELHRCIAEASRRSVPIRLSSVAKIHIAVA